MHCNLERNISIAVWLYGIEQVSHGQLPAGVHPIQVVHRLVTESALADVGCAASHVDHVSGNA